MPPILFPSGALDLAEARKLAEEDKKGRPVYVLLAKPLTSEWQSVLRSEAAQVASYFTVETIADNPELGLYRLKPR
jgi:hypothetical protein